MKRLIRSINKDGATVKVYYDATLREYSCCLIVAGCVELPDSTYYTDNKEDAITTASKMHRAELAREKSVQSIANAA